MLTVSEARAQIMAKVEPLDIERISVFDAVGRILAGPIEATRALPPWDNSAMDGYAVRAAEIDQKNVALLMSDEIPAGDTANRPLLVGTVARIFTGAPMPDGADSVVMQENTRIDGSQVVFTQPAELGRHVRRQGSDVQVGQRLLEQGRVLSPGDLGLLAAQGQSEVSVYRRPVVAICSTGDELVEIDVEPKRGQIVNSNAAALAAAVQAAGGIPHIMPIVPDDQLATVSAIREGAKADVLLTSGGVSVGDYDFVGEALRALSGDQFAFWKVAIKPGKPLAFGQIDDCLAFGLPGNPISALVTFEIFVRPALLRSMGHTHIYRRPVVARLTTPITGSRGRQDYRRATAQFIDGEWQVDASRTQSSGALRSLGGADALLIIPPNTPGKVAGDTVTALVLGRDGPATRSAVPIDPVP